jgi:Coenzyme PQQ synthesis protein D (PqqD)
LTAPRIDEVFGRSERIVGRRIAGEYVLVPLVSRGTDADFIYTLNAVATAIWEALDGRASGEAVVHSLVQRFEVDVRQATEDYLRLMETLESIEAVHRV